MGEGEKSSRIGGLSKEVQRPSCNQVGTGVSVAVLFMVEQRAQLHT